MKPIAQFKTKQQHNTDALNPHQDYIFAEVTQLSTLADQYIVNGRYLIKLYEDDEQGNPQEVGVKVLKPWRRNFSKAEAQDLYDASNVQAQDWTDQNVEVVTKALIMVIVSEGIAGLNSPNDWEQVQL